MTTKSILILGGTADARKLAEALTARGDLTVITSLAGRTSAPAELPGRVRRGGFGGANGLAAYIHDENIHAVIDATHPFAAQISANAQTACRETNTPRLYLARPRWALPAGADVTTVPDFAAAATHVAKTARRVLLTTGGQGIDAFSNCGTVHFLVRLIEQAKTPLPLAHHDVLLDRPPFDVESERALMADQKIDTLITKESGGAATAAKLIAAAECGVKVVMITRPTPPEGDVAEGLNAAQDWLNGVL